VIGLSVFALSGIGAITPPWTAPLTVSEHTLIFYFLTFAGLALFFGFVRAWVTRNEVGSRYRTAIVARLGIMSTAALTYVILIYEFNVGYALRGGVYQPNSNAILAFEPRYVEWSVTVPLLVVELLAVCVLVGARARRARAIAAAATFAMIFAGFLGAFVIDNGRNLLALVLLGIISAVFWAISNVVVVRVVQQSMRELTPEGSSVLKAATLLLLCGWIVYPIVYLIQIVSSGGAWATVIQVTLCLADVIVKLGFSGLIHRAAKLRTAEDVRAGEDVHPEAIWITSVKQSDAGVPRRVYLDPDATVHTPRPEPAILSAVPTEPLPEDPDDV
jgi:bacteriorhodopsin